jgi:diguanylate cyclase (GGDEF)-like protein
MSFLHQLSLRRLAKLRPPVLVIAAASLLWSVATFTVVWHWEDRLAASNVVQSGATHFLALQTGLDEYLGKLRALQALFASDEAVSREEFSDFTARLLAQDKGIQNFSWIPLVRGDRRAAFEAAAQAGGRTDFHIRDVGPGGLAVVAEQRGVYLPIYYSSEGAGARRIDGLDLLAEAPFRRRLLQAIDADSLSTVPDFLLHSRDGLKSGIVVSLPVYKLGARLDTIADRRKNFRGFVHGAFVTADALARIVKDATTPVGFDLYVFPANAGPDDRPLYVHSSRLTGEVAPALSMADIKALPHAFGSLHVGAVHWPVAVVAAADGPLGPRHDRAWLVLACNLLVAGFAAWYERKLLAANRRIAQLAHCDPLTGLLNRRAFNERLATAFAAWRRGGPGFALLYFDLDAFKDINDTRGHPAGDRLLIEVARRLREAVGDEDLVGRFGGDEFAVLHCKATGESTLALAELSKRTLGAPYDLGGELMRVTASIGIAANLDAAHDVDTLMMQADLALYRAKHDGRNRVSVHTPDLDEVVRQRVTVAAELLTAIERDQLRLWYQPQVELASGRIVGVEALLRWQHPTRGLLAPAEFLGMAEHAGLIDKVGAWVLDEACRQARAWKDSGIAPPVIAVNISAQQFKATPALHEVVTAALARHRVDAAMIELELTETVLMEVTRHSSALLQRLQKDGLRISIDDFGTGYSSLNYLTRFPVSRLKIAQELVLGIVHDARNAAVVRAAIHLADELGIECMAEGIETAKQLEFLLEAGCGYGQGYYFSRPMGAERVSAFLRRARPPAKPSLALVG